MPHRLKDVARSRPRPPHLPLLARGLVLVSAPLIFQVILVIFLFNAQRAVTEAERRASHTEEVIAQAGRAQERLTEAIMAMRGSVVSGHLDLDGFPPLDVERDLADLRALVSDNPEQLKRVDRIAEVAIELQRWLEAQRELVLVGNLEEAARLITSGGGARRLRAARAEFSAFLEAEHRLEEQRRAAAAAARERERTILIVAAILGLVVAGLLAYIFARSIGARLAVVSRNARRLAEGLPLAPRLEGDDEIARLDEVLHASARDLAEVAANEARYKRELEQRAAELAMVNHELAQQARENELFIYSVSHDLRSPLVNLQGFSKELARSCNELRDRLHQPDVPPEVRRETGLLLDQEMPESVEYIRTAVARSASIIDALLRLSRAGRVEYRLQRVAVQEVVSDVLTAMRGTITERDAEIVVHPLEDVWADRTAVEQIFANIINNAVNYLDPARRGRIEIGMAPNATPTGDGATPPAPAPEQANGWRTFYVSDNGTGIPEAHLSKVFVAFQRLQPQSAVGEGIGLALVRRIVERHGGRIWVESQEGHGSTFFVTLPAPSAADSEAGRGTAGEPAA
ncbi:MAG TPA: ATP-binding protein [Vicinamibacterales bacterium]